jgi:hypothetical protein
MTDEKISSETQDNQAAQAPTKEQIIAFFQEQIDVKKVQAELQELNTKLAVLRAEELKALSFIAQLSNPKPSGQEYEGGRPHTLTEEDFKNNPELSEEGFQVGDKVIIPNEQINEPKKERSLKK